MLEIVFSEIAANRLIAAQHVGEGPYRAQAARSVLSMDGWPQLATSRHADDSVLEEEARRRWENATPLGGTFSDVFCFPDDYSIGPVVGWGWSRPEARVAALEAIFAASRFSQDRVRKAAAVAADNLSRLLDRLQSESTPLRIWSSSAPKDYCGTCWLLDTIRTRLPQLPEIIVVCAPPVMRTNDEWPAFNGWGNIAPDEYSDMLRFATEKDEDAALFLAREWHQAEKQNGTLRAVLNGMLVTVPMSFYDIFLENAAARIAGEFRENDLIFGVLDQNDLQIDDEWLAFRIDAMVADGRLRDVATAGEAAALYSRMLAKGPSFPHQSSNLSTTPLSLN